MVVVKHLTVRIMTQYKNSIKGKICRIAVFAMLSFLVPAFALPGLVAQTRPQQPVTVYGTVKDVKGVPLMGAQVLVQESTERTETDEGGNFEIVVPRTGSVLTFQAEGFEPFTITVSVANIDVVMQYSVEGQGAKDRVFMPWMVTDKRSVTGSVSSITHDELRKSPVINLSNALTGRLSGFTVLQTSARPGFESTNWRIRGIRTLEDGGMNNLSKGGIGTPIAIVDGFERAFIQLDPSEIESFSILKDAAATAIYGIRGANGVILINTRRGTANRRSIDLEVSSGIVTPTRLPEFYDSYNFAKFYNEARTNDGLSTVYPNSIIEKYRNGSDPLNYPDNNYIDDFMKPYAHQSKAALTMSGGNSVIRYFTAVAYNRQGGLWDRIDENPEYETKSMYQRFNLRTNLDINISKRAIAFVNVSGRIQLAHEPFESDATIMTLLTRTPPNAFTNSFTGIHPDTGKETFMLGGTSIYTMTPLRALGYRGFAEQTDRYYQINFGARYDLDFITEGLRAGFAMDLDGFNFFRITRSQTKQVWQRTVQADGSVTLSSFNTATDLANGGSASTTTWNGLNFTLNYDRTFGLSRLQGFAMLRRYKTVYLQANLKDRRIEDYVLRLTWSYNNKYFIEATNVLSGSDNTFTTNEPRILFPAVSGAWIVSEESFLEGSEFLSFLKLRGSFGMTGNDEYTYTDPNGHKYRYPNRPRYWTTTGTSVQFGITPATPPNTAYEGIVANMDFTMEKARMANFGIDMKLFSNRLVFATDFWFEHRYDIFTRGTGTVPQIFGALESYLPIANEGIVDSKGFEVMLGWQEQRGKFGYWVNLMLDKSQSKIIEMAEPVQAFDYMTETGQRVRQDFGLVALGLFRNQDDIDNSPVQTFGPVKPGDIKYEDQNGDNVIDMTDVVPLGNGQWPTTVFASDLGFSLGQFDFSMLWQGTTNSSVYLSNLYVRPFRTNGGISTFAANRYTDEASWATADFPRLSTLASNNNDRISTFWLYDITYLRLKNLEIGYNLTNVRAKKLGLYGVRFYLNAFNLFTFDNFKHLDPEDLDAGVTKYPLTKVTNLGVILKF